MSDTTTEQEDAILNQGDAIRATRAQRYREHALAIERRITALHAANGEPFTDAELIYAATSRCLCGAGMAYPDGIGIDGHWDCSAILKGAADTAVTHQAKLPFMFYELKSEGQPSAQGATTRPQDGP